MKQVFIINGSGGVGKDTFIKLVNNSLPPGHKVMNYSSVERVKEIAYSIGWAGNKTEKDRKMLSGLKKVCSEYNDMPFKSMMTTYERFMSIPGYDMLFLHVREPKEIERARITFGAKTILIKRDSVEQITSNEADAGVYDYDYDIIVHNDGSIQELEKKTDKFVNDCAERNVQEEY